MKDDSTHRRTPGKAIAKSKPKKPRKNFPLSMHKGSGYWCKKVHGKVHYFGKVSDDPKGEAAEKEWDRVKDDLQKGREPRPKTDDSEDSTIADLCNKFLTHKAKLRDNGELSPRTFRGHYDTCANAVKVLGNNRLLKDIVPDNFRELRTQLSKTRGAVALRNEMQRVRGIFKFAFDEELILAPVRYGQGFDKPKLDAVRRAREAHRSEHGDRMFEAHELRLILEALSGKNAALKAMTLLGLNCGFGQSDVSNLPTRNVNLETGWVDFARVKTAVPRRIPLWPETAEAIREWLPLRPKAKDSSNSKLLFLTIRGARWVTVSAKTGAPKDAVAQEFVKLLRKLGMKRPGVSFYALRHTFEMIAGESRDQVAVNAVMGHVDNSMAGAYRERISDERLKVVVETVRQWLLADTATDPTATKPEEVDLIELPVKPSDDDLAPKLRLFVG